MTSVPFKPDYCKVNRFGLLAMNIVPLAPCPLPSGLFMPSGWTRGVLSCDVLAASGSTTWHERSMSSSHNMELIGSRYLPGLQTSSPLFELSVFWGPTHPFPLPALKDESLRSWRKDRKKRKTLLTKWIKREWQKGRGR